MNALQLRYIGLKAILEILDEQKETFEGLLLSLTSLNVTQIGDIDDDYTFYEVEQDFCSFLGSIGFSEEWNTMHDDFKQAGDDLVEFALSRLFGREKANLEKGVKISAITRQKVIDLALRLD